MEKFKVTYCMVSGNRVEVIEEHESLQAAVDRKANMFDLRDEPEGSYFTYIAEDGGTSVVNPKFLESVMVNPIPDEKEATAEE